MSRLALVLSLLLLAALPAAADAATVRKGPSGTAFYKPPSPLPGKGHGGLIWARKLTGTAALKGGAGNRLVLYRSTGVDGKPVAVSGTVSVPKGQAPKGGWPVITWGHGTTGIADACAPSRDSASNPAHGLIAYAYPLLQRWLKAGYAVVRTDYEGLGTPGDHPYLIGRSEGYSMLDTVRAARKLDKRLGRRVIIAGHSQGGQAALWAASLAPQVDAGAEGARHASRSRRCRTSPSRSALLTALTRARRAQRARRDDPARHRRGRAAARRLRRPQRARRGALPADADERAWPSSTLPSSFGSVAPAELLRPDVDTAPIAAALAQRADPDDADDPHAACGSSRATTDTTVFKAFTDQLVGRLLRGREAS